MITNHKQKGTEEIKQHEKVKVLINILYFSNIFLDSVLVLHVSFFFFSFRKLQDDKEAKEWDCRSILMHVD